jgi:hypothetical protein
MVDFMARFQDYSPFNNMLVKPEQSQVLQPRIGGTGMSAICGICPPMLILAPMRNDAGHDQDQTEGKTLGPEFRGSKGNEPEVAITRWRTRRSGPIEFNIRSVVHACWVCHHPGA